MLADDELSLQDLARDNEDWDSEAEDQPDPDELQYRPISWTISNNYEEYSDMYCKIV